jgi:hypothetical protein
VSSGQTSFTQINYGGHEWIVVGTDSSPGTPDGGLRSPAGTLTLLLKNGDNNNTGFGNGAFRTGQSTSFPDSSRYSGNTWWYANNPGTPNWVTPSEYRGSTLQQTLDAAAAALPAKERQQIAGRTLTNTNRTPWGGEIDIDSSADVSVDARYWALSYSEWLQLTGQDARAYANDAVPGEYGSLAWWLRSPDDVSIALGGGAAGA